MIVVAREMALKLLSEGILGIGDIIERDAMKRIWVHKAKSFEDAERFERRYYRAMSARERVETVDWLRQVARKFKKIGNGRTRLRRVITIVQ